MLTDTKIKNLKAGDKLYKVSDRDGLYVAVQKSGTVSFRYDYRINGRRETLTIGKYGAGGLSLAEAREKLQEAKKLLSNGVSPAIRKQEFKSSFQGATKFKDYAKEWEKSWRVAESTKQLRLAIFHRLVLPKFGNRLMSEINHKQLREFCEKVRDEGAPSTALNVRTLVYKVFVFASERGYEGANPAERISPSSIARFTPRSRTLTEKEIGIFFNAVERTGTNKTIILAIKFVLLTMLRKGEFINAKWDMVDWNERTLTLPAELMKMKRPHRVYLSDQAYEILVTLRDVYPDAIYLHPGRFSNESTLSHGSLLVPIRTALGLLEKDGNPMDGFTIHDLRRTASTMLHEREFNSDWIEKCLAHEQRDIRAVYNKAEYGPQRKDMLQQWADMVEGWIEAGKAR